MVFSLCSLSPVLQFHLLQGCWKSLPIFPGSTTSKDAVVDEILKQLLTCKIVVEEDMVVLAFQESSEVFDNPLAKPLPSLPV